MQSTNTVLLKLLILMGSLIIHSLFSFLNLQRLYGHKFRRDYFHKDESQEVLGSTFSRFAMDVLRTDVTITITK